MTAAGRVRHYDLARHSRLAACLAIAIFALPSAQAHALEQPPAFEAEDLRLGVPLTPTEAEEAGSFCRDTLARTANPDLSPATCACFTREWERRTNRVHRLILPVVQAPDAPQSRRNLAMILRQEGGPREDRLRQLSSEYDHAAHQAFRACGRD